MNHFCGQPMADQVDLVVSELIGSIATQATGWEDGMAAGCWLPRRDISNHEIWRCFFHNMFDCLLSNMCLKSLFIYGCQPKNSGKTPKWMVKIMENPMNKFMIWRVVPFFWRATHMCHTKTPLSCLEESPNTTELLVFQCLER